MLFGQGFNDLFVIRVAGNVLGDECLGSIDFALTSLSANPQDFNALAIHLAKRLRNAASSAQNDETASPEGGGAE